MTLGQTTTSGETTSWAFTCSSPTDTAVRQRYARWIGLQRAWRAGARRGEPDLLWWAGTHADDYAPPLPDPATPLPTRQSDTETLTAIQRLVDGRQWSPTSSTRSRGWSARPVARSATSLVLTLLSATRGRADRGY